MNDECSCPSSSSTSIFNDVSFWLAVINGIAFIISETLGLVNKDSDEKSRSIGEFLWRLMTLTRRDPTVDEKLEFAIDYKFNKIEEVKKQENSKISEMLQKMDPENL